MRAWARITAAGLVFSTVFLGCKSGQESAGDKFLKAGDPVNAIVYYDRALGGGKVSPEFHASYARANIQVLRMRSGADPTADFLDVLKDTILSVLKTHSTPENVEAFAAALFEVGQKRLRSGGPQAEEGAFRFFRAAEGLPGKPADIASKIAAAENAYTTEKLKEIEADLAEAASEPSSGVLADYKMNQLSLILGGRETPETKAMWSKVREQTMRTYLMYDIEGLIDHVDARINKYGLLLGISKYTPGAQAKLEVNLWNGTSGPAEFDGSNFRLVDRQGNAHKPVSSLGAFKKKAMVTKGEESKTGGVVFKLPAGAEADYLELTIDNRVTRKYLP